MHVLVVEREQSLRDAVMTCLAEVGHRPVAAASLEAALVPQPYDVETLCHLLESVGTTFAR